MEWYERALVVAHYRTHLSIEAHVHDAATKKSEADARAAKRRGRRGR